MKRVAISAWLPGNADPAQFSGARSRLLELLRALRRVPAISQWHVSALVARSAARDEALVDALAALPHSELRPVDIPSAPTWRRVLTEGRVLRAIQADFDLIELASLPVPRLRTPCNVLVHDLRDLDRAFARGLGGSRRLIAARSLREAARRARLVLVPSEPVREELEARIPDARGRARVVAPTVEVPAVRDWPDVDAAQLGAIVSLARPEPRKELGFALEVYARADTSAPMLFAGPPDARWAPLRRRAEELGLGARVRFVHDLDDAARWPLLASACAMLFPTRLEGFGLPALEAALVGCPVLVRAGGVPHRVLGDACVAVRGDDLDAWAAQLRASLDEPLGLSAREALAQRFHGARVARSWLATWEEALAAPGASAQLSR